MPNWYGQTVKIVASGEKGRRALDLIEGWVKTKPDEERFISEMLEMAGLDPSSLGDIRLRGYVTDFDRDPENVLTIYLNVAWGASVYAWSHIIQSPPVKDILGDEKLEFFYLSEADPHTTNDAKNRFFDAGYLDISINGKYDDSVYYQTYPELISGLVHFSEKYLAPDVAAQIKDAVNLSYNDVAELDNKISKIDTKLKESEFFRFIPHIYCEGEDY